MAISKTDTNVIKGVAICLMLIHHLFYFKSRLIGTTHYLPMIPNYDLEFYLAKFGSICVATFLFLSGYGLYFGQQKSKSSILTYVKRKILNLYLTYWLYFIVFVPIGLIAFSEQPFWNSSIYKDSLDSRYQFNLVNFFLNFIAWDSNYNEEWWFVKIIVLTLILLFPIYIYFLNKNNTLAPIFIGIILNIICLKLDFEIYEPLGFLFWQLPFNIGLVFAHHNDFISDLISKLKQYKIIQALFYLISLLAIFIIRSKVDVKYIFSFDIISVPLFIVATLYFVRLFKANYIFDFLGQYSFQIWLIHTFFAYYYFQPIVYFPRFSILIFIFLLLISLGCALVIERYIRPIINRSILSNLI